MSDTHYPVIAGYSQASSNSENGDSPELISLGGRDEAVVWEMMGHSGGRLVVPDYGVSLTIPEGSIPQDTNYKLYVGVLLRVNISTALTERQVRMCSVVYFSNECLNINLYVTNSVQLPACAKFFYCINNL